MKIRSGFVSNSSSASFVIDSRILTPIQIDLIINYRAWIATFKAKLSDELWCSSQDEDYIMQLNNIFEYADNDWHVATYGNDIKGRCVIDNFPFDEYLETVVKINDNQYEYRSC